MTSWQLGAEVIVRMSLFVSGVPSSNQTWRAGKWTMNRGDAMFDDRRDFLPISVRQTFGFK